MKQIAGKRSAFGRTAPLLRQAETVVNLVFLQTQPEVLATFSKLLQTVQAVLGQRN